jgi:hypothetical protein
MKITPDYIAGLFDGEGHFGTRAYNRNGKKTKGFALYIGISNNDLPVLLEIQEFLGYGHVIKNEAKPRPNYNQTYCYHIQKKADVRKFLDMIKDRVHIKYRQAELCDEFLCLWEKMRGGIQTSKEDMILAIDLFIEVTKLKSNKNGTVEEKIQKLEKLKEEVLFGGE